MDTPRETLENIAMTLEDNTEILSATLLGLIKQHVRLKMRQRLENFSNARDRCESLYKSFVHGRAYDLDEESDFRLERAYTEDCISTRNVYTQLEYNYIRSVFMNLYARHKHSVGARIHNQEIEINVHNIKQLFLDCLVRNQHFMNILTGALRGKDWINLASFYTCIEAVQNHTLENSAFFFRDQGREFKKHLIIQKLICNIYSVFFKFIDIQERSSLNREELKVVLSMTMRKPNKLDSATLENMVDKAFRGVEEISGKVKETLTLDEFKRIVMWMN